MVKLLIIVFPVLLLVSVPVAHAMLGATAFALWMEGKPMAVIAQRLYSPTQSFPMLAIPFFILAGSLMMSGKFGDHLVNIAKLLVGRFKGGLAQVSIIGSVMFGGVSGSAMALCALWLAVTLRSHSTELVDGMSLIVFQSCGTS